MHCCEKLNYFIQFYKFGTQLRSWVRKTTTYASANKVRPKGGMYNFKGLILIIEYFILFLFESWFVYASLEKWCEHWLEFITHITFRNFHKATSGYWGCIIGFYAYMVSIKCHVRPLWIKVLFYCIIMMYVLDAVVHPLMWTYTFPKNTQSQNKRQSRRMDNCTEI